MPRKKRGKLTSLTEKERLAKRVRNEQRKRVSSAVRWEKEHVKRTGFRPPERKPSRRQREQQAMEAAIAAAIQDAAEGGMLKEGEND